MQLGTAFGLVCLSVCLSVLLTFESLGLQTFFFWVRWSSPYLSEFCTPRRQRRCLTLSSPVMPNVYTSGCSGPYWSNPPFLIFWHSGTLALTPEHQSARMSEIRKGGLDQYGTERFGRLIFATVRKNVGMKGLNVMNSQLSISVTDVTNNRMFPPLLL